MSLVQAEMSNSATPKLKEINGINLEYLEAGSGEPVLFVHGAIGDYRTWSAYQEPVAAKHHYIAYTQRYFGQQDWTDKGEHFKINQFAADLAAFIQALDVGPVNLVSWSYGGMMSAKVAIDHPELVKSMVFFEPAGGTGNAVFEPGDEEKVKPARDAFYGTFGGVATALKAGDAEQAARKLTEAVFELPEGSFETQIAPEFQTIILTNARTVPLQMTPAAEDDFQFSCANLANIKAPVLVVKGEKTNAYWTQISEKAASCIPDAKLEILSGTNHVGPAAKHEDFAQMILTFIDAQP
ncbi:MAG: alpha/beta hydrolase [Thiolinea sp.]